VHRPGDVSQLAIPSAELTIPAPPNTSATTLNSHHARQRMPRVPDKDWIAEALGAAVGELQADLLGDELGLQSTTLRLHEQQAFHAVSTPDQGI